MYLKHLTIEGFRGIGSNLDLPFGKRTIIFGPNGSGKTSALQAIAWAIYGKLPTLSGTVFTREDAIVNDFLYDTSAKVTLTLSDDLTISRTRRKQSSTTKGSNPLTLSTPADDPQRIVEELVGLNLDEFFAAVFLFQETIRDFITTTPEKRSATVDRMLGTSLLRSLVRAVDPKLPANAIEEAGSRIASIDQQLAQAAVISREVIQQRKSQYGDPTELPRLLDRICEYLLPVTELLRLPAPEAGLSSLASLVGIARNAQLGEVRELENHASRINNIKDRYIQAIESDWKQIEERKRQYGDTSELSSLIDEIEEDIANLSVLLDISEPDLNVAALENWLETARNAQLDIVSDLEQKVGRLSTLKDRHERISGEMVEEVHIPADLLSRRSAIQSELNTLNLRATDLVKQLGRRQAVETELAELRTQVADLPGLQNEITRIQSDLERLDAEGKQGSLYNQIFSIGQQYLEQIRPEHCPLCKQQIRDLQALLQNLRRETPPDVEKLQGEYTALRNSLTIKQRRAEQLSQKENQLLELEKELTTIPEDIEAELEDTQNKIQAQTNELTSNIAEINQFEARVKLANATREQLDAVLQQIEPELGRSPSEDVAGELGQESYTVRARIEEVRSVDFQQVSVNVDRAKQLSQIQTDEAVLAEQLEGIFAEAERLIGRRTAANENIIEILDQATQTTATQTAQVQSLDFSVIETELNRARQLEQIRIDDERARDLESSFRTAEQEKARLKYRIQRFTELRNALQDIAETAKLRQQSVVTELVNALDIHRFYQQLSPHPTYRQLQLEPELTSKGTFDYWIKALTDDRSHSTYVQTRFSTAQANAAAIAIFLAVNEHLSKKLETIILDDPSQSMDAEHKQKLAQTLSDIPRQVIVSTQDEQMLQFLTEAFDVHVLHELGS